MKKLFLILAAVLMIVLPAAAADFGGSVDASAAAVFADDIAISPSFKVTGWVKVPFGANSFSAEAYYKGNIGDSEFSGFADVSLLKLSFALPVGTVNVGRYFFSDVTSSVFAMTSDGLNAALNAGLFKIGAYVGYTGLLSANSSGMPAADADMDSFYPLSSKNLVFLANISAPNFFGGNTFAFEALGGMDLNGGSDAVNSFYGTLSAAGPITTTVYYSASATGSYLTTTSDNAGIYAKGSIVAYLPINSMSLTGSVAFGSENFQAISFNPCAGGVLDAGIAATMKPIDSLLCLLSADIYAGTADGFKATSATWTALAKWQALSDVSAFLSIGQDIPLADGSSSFTASLGGTVSF